MITVVNQESRADNTVFEFRGLSGDNKPTSTYNDEAIGNGSIFIEIDTQKILFYDGASDEWVGGDD